MSKIRWGIIGPGDIAHRFAKAFSAITDGTLLAVASRDGLRAKAFADQYGISRTYDSYEAMIEDPEVDAVYVATPHRFHHTQALLALKGKKHLLVEKPMCVNATEASELIQQANAQNCFLLEAVRTRFLPLYQILRTKIEEGHIGTIKHIQSNFSFNPNVSTEHRLLNPQLAGGALLDVGIYSISLAQFFTGINPCSFKASAIMTPEGIDQRLMVTLNYPDQITTAQFCCGLDTHMPAALLISGSEGYIEVPTTFSGATQANLFTKASGKIEAINAPFESTGFEYQIRAVQDGIRAGLLESPLLPHSVTLQNIRLMDAIRKEIGLKYPFE